MNMYGWRVRLVGLLPLFALGCTPGNSPEKPATPSPLVCEASATPEFAYFLSGYTVSMYTVNSCTGALTATAPASVATGTTTGEPTPEQMVIDPAGRFAYVANLVSNASDQATISMYKIDPGSGLLTPTSPASVPTGFFPQGIGIDPSGRFVYTANSDDNTVSMFTIDQSTGVLTPTSPATVATGWSPLSVTIDPSGRFAYVANQDDDTVSMYTVNASTGVLSPTNPATVRTDQSPFGVTVDPSGKFAYVPNAYSNGNTVSQYTINTATGVLVSNTPGTVSAGRQPTSVAVNPAGTAVYVTNRQDNSVSILSIDPNTGNLTPKATYGAGSEPFRMAFDPSGRFGYVSNENSAASIYKLNGDGTLAEAGVDVLQTGSFSVGIVAVK